MSADQFQSTLSACQVSLPGRSVCMMLDYPKETALQGGLVMAKSGRLEMGDNIYGHYISIFDHCDVFGQQSNRIR